MSSNALFRTCARFTLLVSSVFVAACDETGPRVYTARLFHASDMGGGCLDAYAPIALVEADELSADCDPICLVQGEALYVSTVCAPYPSSFEEVLPEASAECVRARELLTIDDASCE
ncbi:MAG: hypothetical protein ACOY0T_14685 [Myxococcota bacterium]